MTLVPTQIPSIDTITDLLPVSKNWNDYITGNSNQWAELATPMNARVRILEPKKLLVLVDISRVQHDTASVNTAFRILCNNAQVALANTGNSCGWDYRSISMHAIVDAVNPGLYFFFCTILYSEWNYLFSQ